MGNFNSHTFTGFIEFSPKHYGLPFSWLIFKNVEGNFFDIDPYGLYWNFAIFTIAMYIIFSVISKYKSKKKNQNDVKIRAEETDQDKSGWINDSAFVKY